MRTWVRTYYSTEHSTSHDIPSRTSHPGATSVRFVSHAPGSTVPSRIRALLVPTLSQHRFDGLRNGFFCGRTFTSDDDLTRRPFIDPPMARPPSYLPVEKAVALGVEVGFAGDNPTQVNRHISQSISDS